MALELYGFHRRGGPRPDPDPPARIVCAGDPLDPKVTLCDARRGDVFKVEDNLDTFRWRDRRLADACEECAAELCRRVALEDEDPDLPPPYHGRRGRRGTR